MYKFYYTNGYGVTSYILKSTTSSWNIAWNPDIRKWLMRINLTCLMLLIAFMQVSLAANAQKISLSKKNAPLTEIFKELREQSGYDFVINKDQIKLAKPVTIIVKGDDLINVLNKCFEDQPFTYSMEDKMIIVVNKRPEQVGINAPPIDVRGRLVDENGSALVGASVSIKGTDRKTVTNENGEFLLTDVDDRAILVFSFIGYDVMEISAKAEMYEIHMIVSIGKLDEISIVSTGYQTLPKERATGSFTVIDNKTLNRSISSDLLSRLKGVTNGLLFDNSAGNATGISIRGRSTIFSNTTPLIVVDNFPFEGDLNTINPDLIENVTILKDAAAASIWGVRAGNGVIVITTKKGRINTTPKVSINATLTVGEKPDLYYQPQLNSSEYIDVERFLFDKGAYTATINNGYSAISPVVAILQKIQLNAAYAAQGNAEIDVLRNIDNRDQLSNYFYRKSSVQHYSADVTGGGKSQSYYFSAGYDKNLANLISQSNDRITLKGNNNYSLLNDRLKLNTDVTFSKSNTDNTNTMGYSPYVPYELIADGNGNSLSTVRRGGGLRQAYIDTVGKSRLLDWNYRPLEELRSEGSLQNTKQTDYRLNLGVTYKIINPLSLSLAYQYYNASTQAESTYDKDAFYTRNIINTFSDINSNTGQVIRPIPYGGIYNPNFASRQANYGRAQANFNKIYDEKHEISAIAGYEVRDDTYKQNYYTVYGYRPETGTSSIVDLINPYSSYFNPASTSRISAPAGQGGTTDRYISLYGNASYIYDGKYIVSGSYRKDESNLFGVNANQKGVPLWSTGFAWNLHKEHFFEIGWLSTLQLKATYGYNGNVNNSISAYLTASPSFYNPYGVQSFVIVNPPNDNLRWERVKNTNLGLYFSSKNNRLNGSMEYYIKNGIDLIGTSPIAPQTGISLFTGNTANTHTNGIDVQLDTKNIDGLFKWKSTFIFNYVKDKITEYKVAAGGNKNIVTASTNSLSPVIGFPINSIFAYKWGGLDGSGNPQGYVNGLVSTDYTSIINSSGLNQLQFFGSATPTIFGGLRNSIAYKRLELSFNITYKMGYYFRRESINYASLFSGTYMQPDFINRWQKPGDELITNIPSLIYPNVSNRSDFYNYATVLVEKGDHIRFQDIQLSYSISKKQVSKLPFTNIDIYAYLNNLGILWKANKQGLDPDVRFGYPNPRTIAFGIKTNF